MLAASFWQNPAVIGLVVALPSAALGYLGYRRSMKVDKVAEQAGIATSQATSIGQVVDGLNKIITALQGDNEILRTDVARLRESVQAIQARIDVVEVGSTDMRAKNRELEREIAVLHAENEALKIENQELKARIDELERIKGA